MFELNSLKGYIKGTSGDDNLINTETSSAGDATSSTDPNMFSKNYWFNSQQEEVEEVSDPWLPQLSKTQRVVGFFTFLLLGMFCFAMAGLFLPVLVLKARKFVMLYTMGSLFTIGSFSLLWGPYNHLKHVCSYARLPFTLSYFGTMFATLYCALMLKIVILTVVCAILQIITLAWYIFSYIPGGVTGMKFFTKLFASVCTKSVGKTLPI